MHIQHIRNLGWAHDFDQRRRDVDYRSTHDAHDDIKHGCVCDIEHRCAHNSEHGCVHNSEHGCDDGIEHECERQRYE